MSASKILEKLYAFKRVDIYDAFHKAQPGIYQSHEDQKTTISEILDNCCRELIRLFETEKKPTKVILRQVIANYMDQITHAPVNTESKDFGYELCWFLAEKVGIDKRSSDTKVWGYWRVEAEEVKAVTRIRKPKPPTAKQ